MDLKMWNAKVEALAADLAALELDETLDPDLKQQLAKSMRSVIGAKTRGAKAPLGGSKLGGRPHAEKSFVWPTAKNVWNDRAIEPLALVAQLNLADLAVHDPTGLVPKTGRLLFFMLPIEYDPMSHRAYTHVVPAGPVVEHAPPRGLAAAGGVFKAKALEFFPTVRFPDRNGGFLSFDDSNEQPINRVLKKHGMRPADVDALLDKPAFSSGRIKGYSPKKDMILLRFFGEVVSPESLWFETEMMLVIGKEAAAKGDLASARIAMGEST